LVSITSAAWEGDILSKPLKTTDPTRKGSVSAPKERGFRRNKKQTVKKADKMRYLSGMTASFTKRSPNENLSPKSLGDKPTLYGSKVLSMVILLEQTTFLSIRRTTRS
jgi:hypothetical protein